MNPNTSLEGDYIFIEGDNADKIYFIESGYIEILYPQT